MKKLYSLIKATMSGGIQIFDYRGKTERSRRIMPVLLAIFIGVMMFFSANEATMILKEDGAEATILSMYALMTTVVILMEGIYKSGDLLFKSRDNDMLLAMPIKKPMIVFARIVKFYIFELVYCLIFLLPAMVAYAINVDVGASYYLVAITVLLLLPVIPIAISCIVGAAISSIAARFRHKSFWQVIFSFTALFLFAALLLFANTTSGFNGHLIAAASDKLANLYYPASALGGLVTDFNIWHYLMFVVIHLVVMGVTVAIIGRFYFRIVTWFGTNRKVGKSDVNYRFTRHGQISAMVRKEMSKYFSTPVLLMNTAIGLVLYAVAVGALCIQYNDIVSSMMSSVEGFPLTADEIYSFMPSATLILVAFASLMTFITVTMISLEGKAFNQLKSMPISGLKVIMSKVLAAILLIVPVTALGSIVMAIRFQFGILETILILVAVVAMPLVTELIGILIDLKYARFNAENDAVVVKQSAGVMVATFLGLGMLLLTASLAFVVIFVTGQIVGLLIMDALFVVVSLFLYFAVATWGTEKYTQLTA